MRPGVVLLAAVILSPVSAIPFAQPATTQQATIKLSATKSEFRAAERIGVSLDARPLRNGSSHRLIVVATDTPDAINDTAAFAVESTRVSAALLKLTLPPASSGKNEIRLYYIPSGEQRYVIAARAPVDVRPGTPDAIVAHTLMQEARLLGPVRFEAKYRDQQLLLEGQFLRVETRTTGPDWAKILQGSYNGPKDYMVLHVGHLGTERGKQVPAEILCLMDATDRRALDRTAALNAGDIIVLRGAARMWGPAAQSYTIIFDRCSFVG